MVVGLTHSTRGLGKPEAWGRGQRIRDGFRDCRANTRGLGKKKEYGDDGKTRADS